MIMNEAQQRERIAHGVGSMALALDVLVLIVLAKFVGPIHPKGTPGDWADGRHLKWRECTCSDDPSPRNDAGA